MMYIHYCKYCRRIHIPSGHKVYCPACRGRMTELGISYIRYVNLNRNERQALREKCADEKFLQELSVEYRMHRYSKWFKNTASAPAGSSSTDSKAASRPECSPRLQVSVS